MILTSLTPEQMHAVYTRCSGLDIKYVSWHKFTWERWCFEGWTEKDLELVCAYLHRQIRSGKSKFTMATFKMRNLIEDIPRFADELAMAKAQARVPKQDKARNSVLRATGRAKAVVKDQARSSAEILANREQGAAMLAKWRKDHP